MATAPPYQTFVFVDTPQLLPSRSKYAIFIARRQKSPTAHDRERGFLTFSNAHLGCDKSIQYQSRHFQRQTLADQSCSRRRWQNNPATAAAGRAIVISPSSSPRMASIKRALAAVLIL